MTEVYIDDKRVMLAPGSIVAVSKCAHNLDNPQSRNGDTTNKLKAPRNNYNNGVFENSDVIISDTNMPYSLLNARIVQDGIETIRNGVAVIDAVGDMYEFTIIDGNVNFFDLLGDKKLSDIVGLATYNHLWNLNQVITNRANTSGFIYGIIDFGKLVNTDTIFDARYQMPAIFRHTIFDLIVSEAGFNKEGEIFDDATYKKTIIPCEGPINKRDFTGKMTNTAAYVNSHINHYQSPIKFINTVVDPYGLFADGVVQVTSPGSMPADTFTVYTAPNSGVYSFRVKFDYTHSSIGFPVSAQNLAIVLYRIAPASTILSVPIGNSTDVFSNTSGSALLEVNNISLVKGDRIYVGWESLGGGDTFTMQPGGTFECFKADVQWIDFGNELIIADIIPDMKQVDFIKSIMNEYCLLSQTDTVTNIIKFKKLDDVKANIPNAVDWSKKFHRGTTPNISFRIASYNQTNDLKFKEDNAVTKGLGDGIILVADEVLNPRDTIIQLPFSATEMDYRLENLDVPVILKIDNNNRWTIKTEPRVLICEQEDISGTSPAQVVTYKDGVTTTDIDTAIPLCRFIRTDKDKNMGFDNSLIDDNYGTLEGILDKCKRVKGAFNLSELDVANVDHFIPVHLDINEPGININGDFYLNLIDKFQRKKLTQVDLIRL